jgi:hypothetical protein
LLFLGSKDGELGKFSAVTVYPGQYDAALVLLGKREDVLNCVQVLRQGVDLKLLLQGPGETYVNLPVPNDGSFTELYDQAYETVAKSDARSDERKSLFDRIFR